MGNYLYLSPSGDGYVNIGTDEWFLDHVSDDDLVLYGYVNTSAVIIGRNQNPWKECDLRAMEADGVQLVRRVSGGGAVYHDGGNLNFSFCAGKNRYDRDRQFSLVMDALRSFGIDCAFSGRNDILCGDRKFSGNAFSVRDDRRLHHGTLLVSTELDRLPRYLNPDPRKLQSKGISSVRSRVCNLCEICPTLTVPALWDRLSQCFLSLFPDTRPLVFTDGQKSEVQTYIDRHRSWDWYMGKTPRFDIAFDTRFSWGLADVRFSLEKSRVVQAQLFTDANDVTLSDAFAACLVGLPFTSAAISAALRAAGKTELCDLAVYLEKEI